MFQLFFTRKQYLKPQSSVHTWPSHDIQHSFVPRCPFNMRRVANRPVLSYVNVNLIKVNILIQHIWIMKPISLSPYLLHCRSTQPRFTITYIPYYVRSRRNIQENVVLSFTVDHLRSLQVFMSTRNLLVSW